jgi:DNA-binding NtrC family response regulator
MNGKQLADVIKKQRPDLKVLYTTGYTRNAVIHNGMLDRDVSFLPKPFTIQQLATKVRQALDQRATV